MSISPKLGGQGETHTNLFQREFLSVANDDFLVGRCLHLLLDKSKQMLVVHARSSVDVGIDLIGREEDTH